VLGVDQGYHQCHHSIERIDILFDVIETMRAVFVL